MKKTPWALKLFAVLLGAVAISFPIQIMGIYGFSPLQVAPIFDKISLLNWLVIGGCLFQIPLLMRASGKLYFTLPVLFLMVTWNNIVVGHFGGDFNLLQTSLATLSFLSFNALMLHKDVRYLMAHQNQRWWLQAQRHTLRVPLQVNFVRGKSHALQSWDLSESGMFIAVDVDKELDFVEPPKPGDFFDIKLNIDSVQSLKCRAKIIRRAEASGSYPKGLGVEFVDVDKSERQFLKRYLEQSNALQR